MRPRSLTRRALIPRTPLEWVEKLAGAGMYIAVSVSVVLSSASATAEWSWAAVGMALALVSAAAGISRRLAGRRILPRKGGRGRDSGLSARGRGDDDALAAEPAQRWRMLAGMSRLMPASAGRRWLAEAESILAEITAARRGAAVRSYLLSAPRLAVMMWAREVLRRAGPSRRRPG